jgi:hypothetical protein
MGRKLTHEAVSDMDVKGLQCEAVLLKKTHIDKKGHTVLDDTTEMKLESQGFTPFLRCPYCRAKNVVTNMRNRLGINEMAVSHVLKEQ